MGCSEEDVDEALSSAAGGADTTTHIGHTPDSEPDPVYMWVSSTNVSGNLGGLSGADDHCVSDADDVSAELSSLTHKAVIGTASRNPKNMDIGGSDRPVMNLNNEKIVDTYTDFFDSSITAEHAVISATTNFWTGLDIDGSTDTSKTCSNWSTNANAPRGARGRGGEKGRRRFQNGTANCNINTYKLLCISY